MVDIHSHILYGIDDGAKTIEDSLAMLAIATASGTTDIVASPHSNVRYAFDPSTIETIKRELQQRAGGEIRIHRGCDFHLDYDNIVRCMREPHAYTINGLRYLLLEFPETAVPGRADNILQQLMDGGITPVITHPERNFQLMSRLPEVADWVRAGCLIQITAGSLTGSFGERAKENCRRLMRQKLAHFVASDAHDPEHRTPDLRPAFELISNDYGAEIAARLCEVNPRKALAGDAIEIEDPDPEPQKKAWYQFW